jgi:CRISPR-associated protein Cas1
LRLVVDGFGKFLGRKGETIVVREEGKIVQRLQPSQLDQVIISGKGYVSTDALELLASHGVDVLLVNLRGEVLARLSPPEMRTVSTRREQYEAYKDERGVKIAKEIIRSKLRNQASFLASLAKKRVETDAPVAAELHSASGALAQKAEEVGEVSGGRVDEVRERIMGIEGEGASVYWGALAKTLGPGWGFPGRTGRYAEDPINALLNYGYGILLGECLRAIHYAGLDPYGGFLHADRPGKPSLALDLMEEFRAQVVDRVVFGLATKRVLSPPDFETVDGVCRLKDQARREVLVRLLEKLESEVRYREMRIRWSDLILYQARLLAKFLRGEVERYEGFWLRW